MYGGNLSRPELCQSCECDWYSIGSAHQCFLAHITTSLVVLWCGDERRDCGGGQCALSVPARSYGDTQRVAYGVEDIDRDDDLGASAYPIIPVATSHPGNVHSQVHVRHHDGVDHVFLSTRRHVPEYFGSHFLCHHSA